MSGENESESPTTSSKPVSHGISSISEREEDERGEERANRAGPSASSSGEMHKGFSVILAQFFCCGGSAALSKSDDESETFSKADSRTEGRRLPPVPTFIPADRSLPPIYSGEMLVIPAGKKASILDGP